MAIDYLDSSCEANIAENFRRTNAAIEGGGGGVLVVNMDMDTGALDKTWQEIHDAMPSVYVLVSGEYAPVIAVGQSGDDWLVVAWPFSLNRTVQFVASSASGYLTASDDGGGSGGGDDGGGAQ